MNCMISVQSLLWGILFIIAVAVGVLLIMALLKVIKILKRADKFIKENESNFNIIANELPDTLQSVKEGVDSIRKTVDTANSALGIIGNDEKSSFHYDLDSISHVFNMAKDLVQFVVGFFRRD